MGSFRVSIEIGDLAGQRFERIEALVDTGATYTWVPRDVLQRLGLEPEEKRPFILADGREMYYGVRWVGARIGGRFTPTIVIFGHPGPEPLLGVVTLEELGLGADPVNERLISIPGRLKSVA